MSQPPACARHEILVARKYHLMALCLLYRLHTALDVVNFSMYQREVFRCIGLGVLPLPDLPRGLDHGVDLIGQPADPHTDEHGRHQHGGDHGNGDSIVDDRTHNPILVAMTPHHSVLTGWFFSRVFVMREGELEHVR